VISSVQRLFDTHQYGEAGRQIKDFLWEEFADWYVEISKNTLYGTDETAKQRVREVLLHVIDTSLKLLHPIMPYITEEIWQYLPGDRKPLILAQWPTADARFKDADAEESMRLLIDLVVQVRNVRNEYKVDPGRRITAIAAGGSHSDLIKSYTYVFSRLCNVEKVDLLNGGAPEQSAALVAGDVTLYLPLAGMIDLDAERKRLETELDSVKGQITRTEAQLANEGFVNRAKPEIVEATRNKLVELQNTRTAIEQRLGALVG
jgi:valyl-tRNA synthetase